MELYRYGTSPLLLRTWYIIWKGGGLSYGVDLDCHKWIRNSNDNYLLNDASQKGLK